jgi:uncharacterized protein YxjI
MGRIGQSLSKITSLATGELEPPYEVYRGITGGNMWDDVIRLRTPIRDSVVNYSGKWGSTDKAAFADIQKRLKLRNNKTEYEVKKGRRPEGLMFKAALDRPFINITEPMQDITVPMRYQDMDHKEQCRIKTEYPKIDIVKSPMTDIPAELNRTDTPYEIDDLNDQDIAEFIDKNRGEHFTELSNNNAIDSSGSTLVPNYAVEMNRPVRPTTTKDIYNMYNGKSTISPINLRQLNNAKARQILGLYSGNPSGVREMEDRFMRGF